MKVNQGKNERIARVVAGLLMFKKSKGATTKLLALVPIVTGATGYCPAKGKLFGNTGVTSCGKGCGHDHASDQATDKAHAKVSDKASAKDNTNDPAVTA